MPTEPTPSIPASQEPRCADCKNHKAILTFSQGAMDYIHGGCKRICRCCYLKIVEQTLTEVQANAEKLRNEVSENGCA